MQEFDLYVNSQEPNLGLYVRAGAALPDLSSLHPWEFYRAVAANELSAELVQRIQIDGHAFQDLG
ncbi:hypothetical protein ESZ00_19905 [Silvibacterium dinghuense]|uniref:Uncharacterized protein n=1 Tax=Silvibacterium dinghuense TaxID=1560006 RepID=A0A4V1NUN2_9BACT|nr:hypothetical protein ESZ00_19905 [Silvibacterium dinghuense]